MRSTVRLLPLVLLLVGLVVPHSAAADPAFFFTTTPCRVYDTRTLSPPPTGQPLAHGVPRSVQVGGVCGVPTNASSVAFNITVTQGTADGDVVLYPGDAAAPAPPRPGAFPFKAGTTRAKVDIAQLAGDGGGDINALATMTGAGDTVHLILDVFGYFVDNPPPVANDDTATFTEDDPATAIPVLTNDFDPENDPFFIASATDPANGTVVLTGGSPGAHTGLTYQPDPNYCDVPPPGPPDTFTYTLTPGGDTATVSVTVNCVEDDPVANDDAATVAEDSGANTINVLANDTDPDGGAKTITAVQNPSAQGGTVLITNAGADLTYEPAADYCNNPPGTTLDTFTYTISPGGDTATVTVTVNCTNDPATAVDDTATVTEDSGANTIDVRANDTDTDGGSVITAVQNPSVNGGTVLITNAGADLTYAPAANYCNNPPGTTLDTFTYTVDASSTATVTVTVNCVDDAPTAVNDTATVGEDSGANTIDVRANDTDIDAGPMTITAVQNPSAQGGTVLITNAGADLTYAPAANYCNDPPGTTLDTFTYDLNGGSQATVTVTVTCLNDGPALDLDADDDKGTGGSDFAITFTEGDAAKLLEDPVDATISDVDSTTLSSLTVTLTNLLDATFEVLDADVSAFPNISKNYDTTTPGVGVLTLSTVTPQPIADFQTVLRTVTYVNSDQDPDATARVVQFVANDGTNNSNTATATVTVVPVNDNPTAVDDTAAVAEDSGANTIDVQANDTDPDGGTNTITAVQNPSAQGGTVLITNAGADLTYQPAANYCNTPPGTTLDTFTYTLSPGGSVATVTVTVNCVDDNPDAVDDAATVTEDSGANAIDVLANDPDPDGGTKLVNAVQNPSAFGGSVLITGGGTGVSYAPAANYCNNPPGTTLDTFTYTLTPGGDTATVTVTVTCIDDDPDAVNDAATVTEDSGANAINVLANDTDVDGGTKLVNSVQNPSAFGGTVLITGGGTGVTYAPAANYCNNPPGTTLDTFTYTLTPGGDMATVTVTVTCVDDPPTAVADAATVNEDSGANAIDVLANDTDIDAGPKTVNAVQNPSAFGGTVLITGGGTGVSYAPALNYCNNPPGTTLDTFTYTLNGGSMTTVTVTVDCVNDPPVADDDAFDTIGNTELRVDLAAAATPHVLEDTGGAPFGVLEGDSDPVEGNAITITGIVGCGDITAPFGDSPVCATTNGGTVVLEADGKFSFKPAAGDAAASDNFQYTIQDNGVPAPAGDTGMVTISRFERVWYVDPNAAGGGNGTSASPFNTLDPLDGAGGAGDSDSPADYIFVHDGTLALSAPMPMEANQHLIGEGVGLSIPVNLNGNGSPTVLVPAGTRPQVTNAAGDAVTVSTAIPVEIVGLSLQGSSNAIDLTTAAALTGSSTLTIGNNQFRGASTEGIDVNLNTGTTGTLNLNITSNSWDLAGTHTGNAIDVDTNAGTLRLDISNNTNVVSLASAIVVDGAGGGTTTITGFANNAVHGNTGGTGISIVSATFDGTPGAPYNQIAGGTTVVGASGNGVGAAGVVMTNVAGDLAFTDLDVFADGGAGLQVAGTGAVNTGAGTGTRVTVGAGVGIVEATSGAAVNLNNLTADLQLSSLKSTNTTTSGVSLTSVSDAASPAFNAVFSAGSSSTITTTAGATGPIFNVSGGNADISYAGTITNTSAAARAVSLTTWSGDDASDDITLSGAIDENGAGILVNGNAGTRPITFSGGMDIDTTTGEGFAATSNTNTGGLHVTGTNTITSTSATALRVTDTTIGASDLTFQNVSSGNNTAAADPANGIVLTNTGTLGGLKVTGTGVSGQGGNGSGGLIQNTTGHGVALTNTREPSFANLTIQTTGGSGINGTQVTDFTFDNGTITGSGDATGESNIAFNGSGTLVGNNANGSLVITDNVLNTAFDAGVHVESTDGTISTATVSNNSLTSTTSTATSKGCAIKAVVKGTASTVANITQATIANNVIANFPSACGIQVIGGNTNATGPAGFVGDPTPGTDVISIAGNSISGQSAANRMGTSAIEVSVNGGNSAQRSQGNFIVSNNNPLTNMAGTAILVGHNGYADGTYVMDGNVIVANNTVASPGIGGGNGIVASSAETPNMTWTITNNNISQTDGNGILAVSRGVTGTLNVGIRNNTVAAPLTGVRPGIRVDAGNASSVDDAVCAEIANNVSGGSGGHAGIGIRKQGTNASINDFGIEGLVPSPATCGQAEDRVSSQNPGAVTTGTDCDGNPGSKTLAISGSNFVTCATAP